MPPNPLSHEVFILGAYAATFLIVALLILRAIIDSRLQLRALADLESRGIGRRSAAGRNAGGKP